MPFYIPLAFKNIFRDKRRSFTLGINYLLVSFLLLLVFSITQGMKSNITDTVITSSAGHITISGEHIVKGKTYQGIAGYPRIAAIVKETYPEARIVTRYTLNSAVYYKNVSKRLSFAGISADTDNGLRDQMNVYDGSWDAFARQPNAVLMPGTVAQYFGLANNDEVLVATRTRFGAFNTGTIQIRGLYKTGNYFLRELVVSHFDFLQSLDLADKVTASKMYVFFNTINGAAAKRDVLIKKLDEAGFIALKPKNNSDALNAVSAASPRYKVLDESVNQIRLTLATAQEVTGIVSQAVAAVNALGLFIAAIMLFIISVAIFINMRMTINERLLEIGTLRAIGAEQKDIVRLFILENVFLSLAFVCAGMAIGLGLMAGFSSIVTLPPEGVMGLFLRNGHFVFRPTPGAVCFIALSLSFFTALFSFFPARYGGRIPPVVALNKTT
jgi:ABC-type lipoprotein release transport system permease subunit